MGGNYSHWVDKGYSVHYCLLTKGEKGINPGFPEGEALAALRVDEQKSLQLCWGCNMCNLWIMRMAIWNWDWINV
jgi:LmbE family N-acetylglucosaminyl deacetylase